MRIASYLGRLTITASIDIADAGKRLDVQRGSVFRICSRIRCLVATAVQLSDDDGVTARLLDVHRNFSTDGALHIIATKHTVKRTIGDIQRHVVINIRLLGTAVCSFQSWDTCHHQLGSTVHRCTLTTAVCLINLEVTSLLSVKQRHSYLAHITQGIRATEHAVYQTTVNVHAGLTQSI